MIHRDLHLERHLGNSPGPRPWAFSHVLTSHQDKASRGPSIICLSPRQQFVLASAPTPACCCLKPQQTPPMSPRDSGPALALETVSSNRFAWEMSVESGGGFLYLQYQTQTSGVQHAQDFVIIHFIPALLVPVQLPTSLLPPFKPTLPTQRY